MNLKSKCLRIRVQYKNASFWEKFGFWGVIVGILLPIIFWFGIKLLQIITKPTPSSVNLYRPLRPGSAPDPPQQCLNSPSDYYFKIYAGSQILAWSDFKQYGIINFVGKETVLAISKKNNLIYISSKNFSPDGRIACMLIDNKPDLSFENHYQIKRPDDSELQVWDHYRRMVLRVKFLNPKSFQIEGIFSYPGYPELTITKNKILLNSMPIVGNCFIDNYSPVIFYIYSNGRFGILGLPN